MYFAIEIISGKNRKYCIKKVKGNIICPVNRKVYKTLDAAQKAAKEMGIRIERVGDIWEIV